MDSRDSSRSRDGQVKKKSQGEPEKVKNGGGGGEERREKVWVIGQIGCQESQPDMKKIQGNFLPSVCIEANAKNW